MVSDNEIKEVLEDLGKPEAFRENEFADNFWKIGIKDERETEKNVVTYEFNEPYIQMVPIFDTHLGQKTCREDLVEDIVNYIDRHDNCYTFLGGDLFESATRDSVGMGMMDESYHLPEQRRRWIQLLKPLARKKKILGAITGNHEMRVQKYNTDNPLEVVCDELDIPYMGYQAYLSLFIKNVHYTVFFFHGASSASSKAGKLNSAMRMNRVADADLYCSGHTHDKFYTQDTINRVDPNSGKLMSCKRTYVVCGSYLDYFGGYPEMKGLEPSLMGGVMIMLDGRFKDIRVLL